MISFVCYFLWIKLISVVFDMSTISSYVITNLSEKRLKQSQSSYRSSKRIFSSIIFFSYTMFYWLFTLILILKIIQFLFWLALLPSNSTSKLHEICFKNFSNSFIDVMLLNKFELLSPVLFGMHLQQYSDSQHNHLD